MSPLSQRQVEILNGFVDFGGVFVADSDAVDAGVFERELHGGLAVGAIRERSFAGQFHADNAHSLALNLFHVGEHLGDIAGPIGVVGFGVHFRPVMVDANHGDFEPFVARHLAKRGEAVAYYEVKLSGVSSAVVRRYQAVRGAGGRAQVAFALTHEVIAKLAGDIAG